MALNTMVYLAFGPVLSFSPYFEAYRLQILEMLKMVPEAGLEPARVSPYAPQAYVSAISPPGHRLKEGLSKTRKRIITGDLLMSIRVRPSH